MLKERQLLHKKMPVQCLATQSKVLAVRHADAPVSTIVLSPIVTACRQTTSLTLSRSCTRAFPIVRRAHFLPVWLHLVRIYVPRQLRDRGLHTGSHNFGPALNGALNRARGANIQACRFQGGSGCARGRQLNHESPDQMGAA